MSPLTMTERRRLAAPPSATYIYIYNNREHAPDGMSRPVLALFVPRERIARGAEAPMSVFKVSKLVQNLTQKLGHEKSPKVV